MNYLISKVTVKEVMTETVVTVTEDTPIEKVALIMAEQRIGCLPVIRND
jgi:acetoin utilization protein AcuB